MRSWSVPVVVVLLSACTTACGGAGKSTGSASSTASTRSTGVARTGSTAASTTSATSQTSLPAEHSNGRYLKDPDLDIGGPSQNSGYRDRDDSRILAYYGHPASAIVSREVAAVAKRYYAAAAAGDGKRACSMMEPSLVKSIPVVYGQLGASYLRGAKTCPAVMVRMFKHRHHELIAPVTVTGVLEKGKNAYALLGSTRIPASFIGVLHEHGAWMIDRPIGGSII